MRSLSKEMKKDKEKVKDSLRRIFYAPTCDHAKEAVEFFKDKWRRKYPSAADIQ